MTAVGSSPRAADVLESQPILDGGAAASHLAAAAGDDGLAWQPATARSRFREWLDDPLVRAGAVNLALILTWCAGQAGWQWRRAGAAPLAAAHRTPVCPPCFALSTSAAALPPPPSAPRAGTSSAPCCPCSTRLWWARSTGSWASAPSRVSAGAVQGAEQACGRLGRAGAAPPLRTRAPHRSKLRVLRPPPPLVGAAPARRSNLSPRCAAPPPRAAPAAPLFDEQHSVLLPAPHRARRAAGGPGAAQGRRQPVVARLLPKGCAGGRAAVGPAAARRGRVPHPAAQLPARSRPCSGAQRRGHGAGHWLLQLLAGLHHPLLLRHVQVNHAPVPPCLCHRLGHRKALVVRAAAHAAALRSGLARRVAAAAAAWYAQSPDLLPRPAAAPRAGAWRRWCRSSQPACCCWCMGRPSSIWCVCVCACVCHLSCAQACAWVEAPASCTTARRQRAPLGALRWPPLPCRVAAPPPNHHRPTALPAPVPCCACCAAGGIHPSHVSRHAGGPALDHHASAAAGHKRRPRCAPQQQPAAAAAAARWQPLPSPRASPTRPHAAPPRAAPATSPASQATASTAGRWRCCIS